jgi:hypothetical protein
MGWAVDDTSFLGGMFQMCDSVNNERLVTQWEHDIIAGTFGSPTGTEIQEFAHPIADHRNRPTAGWDSSDASERVAASHAVGEKVNFAFRSRTSRPSQWQHYYIEGATPNPIVDMGDRGYEVPNNRDMRPSTWPISNVDDTDDEHSLSIAAEPDTFIGLTSEDWTNALRFKAFGDYLRLDHGNTNTNIAFFIATGAPVVDGRTLVNGKLIISDFYRGTSWSGGVVADALRRICNAFASLPDLSVEATALANLLGSVAEISNPIEGGSAQYVSVADATATYGLRWSPVGRIAPLIRGMFDNAQTDRPTLATRTVSLARASGVAGFSFVSGGVAYRKTSTQTVTFSDVTGTHWIYFNAAGNLAVLENGTEAQVTAMLRTNAPVALVYWDGDANTAVYLADERHTQALTPEQHLAMHRGIGARLSRTSSLGFAEITVPDVDDATPDNGDAQISIAGCTLIDEDIDHPSDATSQVLSPVAQLPVIYRSGASGDWKVLAATDYPLAYDGHGMTTGQRAGYNQWTGSTWQLTELTNGQYSYAIIAAWNDTRTRYVSIVGQDDASTVALARAGAESAILSLAHGAMPFPEFKIIGVLIFQTSNSYSNATLTRWVSIDTSGTRWLDWRRMTD